MKRAADLQCHFFDPGPSEPVPYHPGPFYGMPVGLSDEDDRGGAGLIIVAAVVAMVFAPASIAALILSGWLPALAVILAGNIVFATLAWVVAR